MRITKHLLASLHARKEIIGYMQCATVVLSTWYTPARGCLQGRLILW